MMEEVDRVYWNLHQKEWDRNEDPKFDFFEYRPYWWGDEDAPEAHLPNFRYNGVKIWWYKYMGRSMSTNVDYSAAQWVKWFNQFMKRLKKIDHEHMDDIME